MGSEFVKQQRLNAIGRKSKGFVKSQLQPHCTAKCSFQRPLRQSDKKAVEAEAGKKTLSLSLGRLFFMIMELEREWELEITSR